MKSMFSNNKAVKSVPASDAGSKQVQFDLASEQLPLYEDEDALVLDLDLLDSRGNFRIPASGKAKLAASYQDGHLAIIAGDKSVIICGKKQLKSLDIEAKGSVWVSHSLNVKERLEVDAASIVFERPVNAKQLKIKSAHCELHGKVRADELRYEGRHFQAGPKSSLKFNKFTCKEVETVELAGKYQVDEALVLQAKSVVTGEKCILPQKTRIIADNLQIGEGETQQLAGVDDIAYRVIVKEKLTIPKKALLNLKACEWGVKSCQQSGELAVRDGANFVCEAEFKTSSSSYTKIKDSSLSAADFKMRGECDIRQSELHAKRSQFKVKNARIEKVKIFSDNELAVNACGQPLKFDQCQIKTQQLCIESKTKFDACSVYSLVDDKKHKSDEKRHQIKADLELSSGTIFRSDKIIELAENATLRFTEGDKTKQLPAIWSLPAGLVHYSIDPDGNCLFNALKNQLQGYSDQMILRQAVAEYVENHQQDFMGFLEGETIDQRIAKIRQDKVWGGHLEIEVVQRMTGRPVIVVQPGRDLVLNNSDTYFGEPIFVIYNGENHYDGLRVLDSHTASEVLKLAKEKQSQGHSACECLPKFDGSALLTAKAIDVHGKVEVQHGSIVVDEIYRQSKGRTCLTEDSSLDAKNLRVSDDAELVADHSNVGVKKTTHVQGQLTVRDKFLATANLIVDGELELDRAGCGVSEELSVNKSGSLISKAAIVNCKKNAYLRGRYQCADYCDEYTDEKGKPQKRKACSELRVGDYLLTEATSHCLGDTLNLEVASHWRHCGSTKGLKNLHARGYLFDNENHLLLEESGSFAFDLGVVNHQGCYIESGKSLQFDSVMLINMLGKISSRYVSGAGALLANLGGILGVSNDFSFAFPALGVMVPNGIAEVPAIKYDTWTDLSSSVLAWLARITHVAESFCKMYGKELNPWLKKASLGKQALDSVRSLVDDLTKFKEKMQKDHGGSSNWRAADIAPFVAKMFKHLRAAKVVYEGVEGQADKPKAPTEGKPEEKPKEKSKQAPTCKDWAGFLAAASGVSLQVDALVDLGLSCAVSGSVTKHNIWQSDHGLTVAGQYRATSSCGQKLRGFIVAADARHEAGIIDDESTHVVNKLVEKATDTLRVGKEARHTGERAEFIADEQHIAGQSHTQHLLMSGVDGGKAKHINLENSAVSASKSYQVDTENLSLEGSDMLLNAETKEAGQAAVEPPKQAASATSSHLDSDKITLSKNSRFNASGGEISYQKATLTDESSAAFKKAPITGNDTTVDQSSLFKLDHALMTGKRFHSKGETIIDDAAMQMEERIHLAKGATHDLHNAALGAKKISDVSTGRHSGTVLYKAIEIKHSGRSSKHPVDPEAAEKKSAWRFDAPKRDMAGRVDADALHFKTYADPAALDLLKKTALPDYRATDFHLETDCVATLGGDDYRDADIHLTAARVHTAAAVNHNAWLHLETTEKDVQINHEMRVAGLHIDSAGGVLFNADVTATGEKGVPVMLSYETLPDDMGEYREDKSKRIMQQVQGAMSIFVTAKGDIRIKPGVNKGQIQTSFSPEDYTDYIARQIAAEKSGIYMQAGGQAELDASILRAGKGHVIFSGDQGVSLTTQEDYRMERNHKDSGFTAYYDKIWDTKYFVPEIHALTGKVYLFSTKASINGVSPKIHSQNNLTAAAHGNISFTDAKGRYVRHRDESPHLWRDKILERTNNETTATHEIIGSGDPQIYSGHGNIEITGGQYVTPGKLQVWAPEGDIKLSREILENQRTTTETAVKLTAARSDALVALFKKEGTDAVMREFDKTYATIAKAFEASNGLEATCGAWNTLMQFYKDLDGLASMINSGAFLEGALGRYGLTNLPISIGVSQTKTTTNFKSLADQCMLCMDVDFRAKNIIAKNGFQLDVLDNGDIDASESIFFEAAILDYQQKQTTKGFSVGIDAFTGGNAYIGVSYQEQRITGQSVVNTSWKFGGHFDVCTPLFRGIGANVSCDEILGDIGKADFTTLQEYQKTKAMSFSADTLGKVSLSQAKSYSRMTAQQSGLQVKQGIDRDKFRLGALSLTGSYVSSEGAVDLGEAEQTSVPIYDVKRSSAVSLSGDMKDVGHFLGAAVESTSHLPTALFGVSGGSYREKLDTGIFANGASPTRTVEKDNSYSVELVVPVATQEQWQDTFDNIGAAARKVMGADEKLKASVPSDKPTGPDEPENKPASDLGPDLSKIELMSQAEVDQAFGFHVDKSLFLSDADYHDAMIFALDGKTTFYETKARGDAAVGRGMRNAVVDLGEFAGEIVHAGIDLAVLSQPKIAYFCPSLYETALANTKQRGASIAEAATSTYSFLEDTIVLLAPIFKSAVVGEDKLRADPKLQDFWQKYDRAAENMAQRYDAGAQIVKDFLASSPEQQIEMFSTVLSTAALHVALPHILSSVAAGVEKGARYAAETCKLGKRTTQVAYFKGVKKVNLVPDVRKGWPIWHAEHPVLPSMLDKGFKKLNRPDLRAYLRQYPDVKLIAHQPPKASKLVFYFGNEKMGYVPLADLPEAGWFSAAEKTASSSAKNKLLPAPKDLKPAAAVKPPVAPKPAAIKKKSELMPDDRFARGESSQFPKRTVIGFTVAIENNGAFENFRAVLSRAESREFFSPTVNRLVQMAKAGVEEGRINIHVFDASIVEANAAAITRYARSGARDLIFAANSPHLLIEFVHEVTHAVLRLANPYTTNVPPQFMRHIEQIKLAIVEDRESYLAVRDELVGIQQRMGDSIFKCPETYPDTEQLAEAIAFTVQSMLDSEKASRSVAPNVIKAVQEYIEEELRFPTSRKPFRDNELHDSAKSGKSRSQLPVGLSSQDNLAKYGVQFKPPVFDNKKTSLYHPPELGLPTLQFSDIPALVELCADAITANRLSKFEYKTFIAELFERKYLAAPCPRVLLYSVHYFDYFNLKLRYAITEDGSLVLTSGIDQACHKVQDPALTDGKPAICLGNVIIDGKTGELLIFDVESDSCMASGDHLERVVRHIFARHGLKQVFPFAFRAPKSSKEIPSVDANFTGHVHVRVFDELDLPTKYIINQNVLRQIRDSVVPFSAGETIQVMMPTADAARKQATEIFPVSDKQPVHFNHEVRVSFAGELPVRNMVMATDRDTAKNAARLFHYVTNDMGSEAKLLLRLLKRSFKRGDLKIYCHDGEFLNGDDRSVRGCVRKSLVKGLLGDRLQVEMHLAFGEVWEAKTIPVFFHEIGHAIFGARNLSVEFQPMIDLNGQLGFLRKLIKTYQNFEAKTPEQQDIYNSLIKPIESRLEKLSENYQRHHNKFPKGFNPPADLLAEVAANWTMLWACYGEEKVAACFPDVNQCLREKVFELMKFKWPSIDWKELFKNKFTRQPVVEEVAAGEYQLLNPEGLRKPFQLAFKLSRMRSYEVQRQVTLLVLNIFQQLAEMDAVNAPALTSSFACQQDEFASYWTEEREQQALNLINLSASNLGLFGRSQAVALSSRVKTLEEYCIGQSEMFF